LPAAVPLTLVAKASTLLNEPSKDKFTAAVSVLVSVVSAGVIVICETICACVRCVGAMVVTIRKRAATKNEKNPFMINAFFVLKLYSKRKYLDVKRSERTGHFKQKPGIEIPGLNQHYL
jgi:hypothetical protein